jgi:hypothetical protein
METGNFALMRRPIRWSGCGVLPPTALALAYPMSAQFRFFLGIDQNP